jgi:hypothetical protein
MNSSTPTQLAFIGNFGGGEIILLFLLFSGVIAVVTVIVVVVNLSKKKPSPNFNPQGSPPLSADDGANFCPNYGKPAQVSPKTAEVTPPQTDEG